MCVDIPAARFCPGCAISVALLDRRAQGKPGADCARIPCAVGLLHKMHTDLTGTARTSRLSPRNGFTAYVALSPGNGLSCPRSQWEKLPSA